MSSQALHSMSTHNVFYVLITHCVNSVGLATKGQSEQCFAQQEPALQCVVHGHELTVAHIIDRKTLCSFCVQFSSRQFAPQAHCIITDFKAL